MTVMWLSPREQMPLLGPRGVTTPPADSERGGEADSPLTAEFLVGGISGTLVTCAGSRVTQATAFPPHLPGSRVGLELMEELRL